MLLCKKRVFKFFQTPPTVSIQSIDLEIDSEIEHFIQARTMVDKGLVVRGFVKVPSMNRHLFLEINAICIDRAHV